MTLRASGVVDESPTTFAVAATLRRAGKFLAAKSPTSLAFPLPDDACNPFVIVHWDILLRKDNASTRFLLLKLPISGRPRVAHALFHFCPSNRGEAGYRRFSQRVRRCRSRQRKHRATFIALAQASLELTWLKTSAGRFERSPPLGRAFASHRCQRPTHREALESPV